MADVDGHDFSSGEMNIFVLTDQPKETFAQIKESLKEIDVLGGMKAAFRQMADDKFIVLYPGTLESACFRYSAEAQCYRIRYSVSKLVRTEH